MLRILFVTFSGADILVFNCLPSCTVILVFNCLPIPENTKNFAFSFARLIIFWISSLKRLLLKSTAQKKFYNMFFFILKFP